MINDNNIKIMPVKALYVYLKENADDNIKRACITASSFEVKEEKLIGIKRLSLNFDDIKTVGSNSFSNEKAHLIRNFVDEIKEKYDELIICCDSGQSRSSAIAAATKKYLGYSNKDIWENPNYTPNEFVYKIMCEEYGIKVSKIRIRYNMYINRKSLKKKIKEARKK